MNRTRMSNVDMSFFWCIILYSLHVAAAACCTRIFRQSHTHAHSLISTGLVACCESPSYSIVACCLSSSLHFAWLPPYTAVVVHRHPLLNGTSPPLSVALLSYTRSSQPSYLFVPPPPSFPGSLLLLPLLLFSSLLFPSLLSLDYLLAYFLLFFLSLFVVTGMALPVTGLALTSSRA